jgi:hypothetical protein
VTAVAERITTPDVITADDNGHKTTTFTLKRACNGCGHHLGDLDQRDVDEHGNLTDVRGECLTCRPLLELEAAGCEVMRLTLRTYSEIDYQLDKADVFAKGYTRYVDGRLKLVGLRIGEKPDHVIARFGDWIIRHPNGRWTVHTHDKAARE